MHSKFEFFLGLTEGTAGCLLDGEVGLVGVFPVAFSGWEDDRRFFRTGMWLVLFKASMNPVLSMGAVINKFI